MCTLFPFPTGLSYRWLLNEFPNFIPADGRRFVSQTTGNLYIAKTEASDLGNYSCFATSHIDFITKSVFSKFSRLSLAAEGRCSRISYREWENAPQGNSSLAGQFRSLQRCYLPGAWRKQPSLQASLFVCLQTPSEGFLPVKDRVQGSHCSETPLPLVTLQRRS